jgi:multiple antibiotic resistance protein
MSPLLIKICKDFATIWTTIDPIGNVAIFAGLTASLTRAERHRTALRATLYATVILVVAVVAGTNCSRRHRDSSALALAIAA